MQAESIEQNDHTDRDGWVAVIAGVSAERLAVLRPIAEGLASSPINPTATGPVQAPKASKTPKALEDRIDQSSNRSSVSGWLGPTPVAERPGSSWQSWFDAKAELRRLLPNVLATYARWTTHGDWLCADDWQDQMAPRRTIVAFDKAVGGRGEPGADHASNPQDLAAMLRWGGRALLVSASKERASHLERSMDGQAGLVLEQTAAVVHGQRLGLRLPGVTPSGQVSVLRRATMSPANGQRCTFELTLCPGEGDGEDQLIKAVPSVDALLDRLRERHRDRDDGDLVALAKRLSQSVLPTALTREAGVLEHLARRLPGAFKDRVPSIISCQRDERGFVRSLRMNWLEPATTPMAHLSFALEASELLSVLHQRAQIAHLDLRAENVHLTDRGVCFVDFGNAMRLDTEPPAESVQRLQRSLGRGSAIRRRLMAAARRRAADERAVEMALREPGKTLDTLCLALLLPRPDRMLIERDQVRVFPSSQPAPAIATLAESILRPRDPFHRRGKSAADLHRGLRRLAERSGSSVKQG